MGPRRNFAGMAMSEQSVNSSTAKAPAAALLDTAPALSQPSVNSFSYAVASVPGQAACSLANSPLWRSVSIVASMASQRSARPGA